MSPAGIRTVDPSTRRGILLIGTAVFLVVGSLVVGAVTAPSIRREAAENGATLVPVQGAPTGRLVMLDRNGSVAWTYKNISKGGSYHDATYLDDGRILVAFISKGYQRCGQFTPPCPRTGVRIIEPDPRPHVVFEWTYPVRDGLNSEVHDAEMLPNGNLVIADMEYESIFILDPETGERLWTWNASSYYDPPDDPTKTDWLHINDVDRIDRGRFLVSVRNANQLLFIERGKGVVEVVNKYGSTETLNHQHNPQYLGDGRILVADSGNNRVVELHNESGTWWIEWSVSTVGGLRFDWVRDADRLPNGHTLITDSRNNRVVEIDESGDLIASYRVPGLPYEADRLPVGERASGLPAANERNASVDPRGPPNAGHLPVLTTALATARQVVPLPFWIDEWHLLVVLVATVLGFVGVWQIKIG